jgi:DNA-binding MarR family transcriptional regulator
MEKIPPAKSLIFQMYDVSRLFRRQMDQRAQELGLTSAQWRVLATVARAELLEEEPINQASLAERMDMEPITLSRHVDRMQASGLIERRPNPADRRAYQLFLTEAARPLVDKFRAMSSACLAEALAGVSDKEIALVTDVLTRMHTNIVESPAKSEAPAQIKLAAGRKS